MLDKTNLQQAHNPARSSVLSCQVLRFHR